jgi:AcrR family transcriptional regulator
VQSERADGQRRGRPRRFPQDTEQVMLLDAAMRVLARNGPGELAVAEVLAEAQLSTRSFYRHFDSKDALLHAVLWREVGSVARSLERAVASAPDPVAAVEAWIDGYLGTFFEPRRMERAAVFTTPAAWSASSRTRELAEVRRVLTRPLADALRAGHAARVLVSPDAESDALALFALAGLAAGEPEDPPAGRAAVRSRLVRFTWPALGLRAVEPRDAAPGGG